MTTYAITLTAILAGIIGYMAHAIQEEIYELIERRKNSSKMAESEQMDQAVALVEDKLGGTEILQYDKVT